MSALRYVQLINMGGDHCGMGLANDYPDGHEDAATRSRADDSEWIKASDHDDLVRELVEAADGLQKKNELLLAAKCAKEVIHKTLVAISVHNAASKDKIKLKTINSLSNAFARLKEATEKSK